MGYGYSHEPIRTTKKEIHPIWRGVGFLFMILVPALSYGASILILRENVTKHWFPIPSEIIARGADPMIFAKILLTIVLSLVVFALFTLFTFIVDRLFGAPQMGPYDAPPVYRSGPKKRR